MKYLIIILLSVNFIHAQVILNSAKLNGNNVSSFFYNSGIFDRSMNYPNLGFEWPKGTGKTAVFTSGIVTAAYINGSFRMASCSYRGELAPGYVARINNSPVAVISSIFKFYKVDSETPYDYDWLNWGIMVPYGAPFVDVNNNKVYEPLIDKPGIKHAKQTIFICLTDGFPEEHKVGEGFGGGTAPVYSELHLTAWCYDDASYEDVQFIKWDIINKNIYPWHKSYFSIYCDANLGYPDDDYMGCDTIRSLGYVYNADNYDDTVQSYGAYGLNPPAIGVISLYCIPKTIPVSSMVTFSLDLNTPDPSCEKEPIGEPLGAYNLMRGYKLDGTPWVVPGTHPPLVTKFCYSGNPESNTGWTEYGGKIANCGGSLTGGYTFPNTPGNRNFVISHGSDNLTINVNDTVRILAAQLIVRGMNNLNSVTKLKELSDKVKQLCQNGFVIGISPISNEIPQRFNLYQNYPNPFNPVTKIKFSIPKSQFVAIKVYDIVGRELVVLINEKLTAGIYSVDWDASPFPSGIYFYKIQTESFSETKKMVLIK